METVFTFVEGRAFVGNVQRVRPRLAGALAVAAVAVGLVGCATSAGSSSSPSSGGQVVRVAAAENFWGSLAAQLGGSHARVTSIINNPNADPHDYEPTAADARVMASA